MLNFNLKSKPDSLSNIKEQILLRNLHKIDIIFIDLLLKQQFKLCSLGSSSAPQQTNTNLRNLSCCFNTVYCSHRRGGGLIRKALRPSVTISDSCNFHIGRLKYTKLDMSHPCCTSQYTM